MCRNIVTFYKVLLKCERIWMQLSVNMIIIEVFTVVQFFSVRLSVKNIFNEAY